MPLVELHEVIPQRMSEFLMILEIYLLVPKKQKCVAMTKEDFHLT